MKEKLQKLARKADTLRKDITELKETEPRLAAEVGRISKELRGVELKAFIIPPSEAKADDPTTIKLRTLKDLQTKLEMLPAVLSRAQTDLEKIENQIVYEIERAFGAAHSAANKKLAETRQKLTEDFTLICGGDSNRARKAADMVCELSEAEKWRRCFSMAGATARADSEGVRNAIALLERFESGLPRTGGAQRSEPVAELVEA